MELFRALAVIAEPTRKESASIAEALELGPPPDESEYTELFLLQLYPYASVYLGAEGMMGGEARDRVAGFWRALNLVPPAEADHLSVMLALYAQLVEGEEREMDSSVGERLGHARRAFLWEHLLSWLPVYLEKLQRLAQPFYSKWGETLREALFEELEAVGPLESLPLHLREASGIVDPRRGGAEQFLSSLLAPVRSGMILTRADLSRAARTLRLGSRLGERKFILRSLFSQDAHAVLGWLIEETARTHEIHRRSEERLGAIGKAWRERTESSAKLLEELKLSVKEMA